MKASDIHVEHEGDFMRIRFRIDGMLIEYMKTSVKPYKAVVSRIKIMAGLNISEKRLPQDGRIYLNIDNHPIDFRVSTMPTNKYEKVVMRVLDKSNFMASKEELGFGKKDIQIYNELLSTPYGLILVVGPTGSGCDKCNNTGYKGRLGVYEMLKITQPIKELIDSEAKEIDILRKAKNMGMRTIKEDVVMKVLSGQTTTDEMLRVTLITA